MAFASGRLEVSDMIGLGLCMNAIGVVIVIILLYSTGTVFFDLGGGVPDWALSAWAVGREESRTNSTR